MENNLNYIWANQIVTSLINLGINDYCICPGARSTPIAYEIACKDNVSSISIHDERTGGYFALGIAKRSSKAVAIVSTSGTAVANFLPAVIEAYYSMTPLVLLTADRPPELIDTGSNQTINQDGIFSSFVRYERNLGIPKENCMQQMIESICQGISVASSTIPGPVHFNIPLHEPIAPTESIHDLYNHNLELTRSQPIRYDGSIDIGNEPIIVVGPLIYSSLQEEIVTLAKMSGALIMPDPLSNIISKDETNKYIVSSYDYLLRSIDIRPSSIIRFGTKPTSKVLNQWIEKNETIVFSIQSHNRFNDDVENIIVCDPISFCKNIISQYDKYSSPWNGLLVKLQSAISKKLYVHNKNSIPCFVLDTNESVGDGGMLFLGNSSVVRDFSQMGSYKQHTFRTLGNRGASGIDGVLSTALGAASKSTGNNILVIGDMSFLYDLNALQVSRECSINLVVVVMNNYGGQIFDRLDISKIESTKFDRFWKTTHNLCFKDIANFHNVGYCVLDDFSKYKETMTSLVSAGGIHILEIKMDMVKINRHLEKIEKEILSLL